MPDQLNTVIPPPEEEPRTIEEIVSPVRPQKRTYVFGEVVSFVSLLVAVFALGYVVYGRWPNFGQGIKVAKAPQVAENNAGSTIAVVDSATSTTQVTVTEPGPTPTPRISSIATATPNVDMGSVAGSRTSVENKQDTSSTSSYRAEGFTLRIPTGTRVQKESMNASIYTFVTGAKNKFARVEVVALMLDSPERLRDQLLLSPDISGLKPLSLFGLPAFSYSAGGVDSYAIVHDDKVYYIADFSGKAISGFVLE